MTKIILSGCLGRMGRAITSLAAENDEIEIVAGIDAATTEEKTKYPLYHSFNEIKENADAVVDFSNRAALSSILDFCLTKKMPVVLATTGYTDEDNAEVEKAAERIPVFRSSNMSLGVAVLTRLAKMTAELLGDDFDVEIVEKHHNKKLDAPSGTAISLAKAISESYDTPKKNVYDRHSVRQAREKSEIGISSVRGGTIIGEHDCIFAGWNETITISHSAQSREVFASGALKAAGFIAEQSKPGMYGMDDMFK